MRQAAVSKAGPDEISSETEAERAVWWTTPGGIPVVFHAAAPMEPAVTSELTPLRLHLEHARLSLLRGFDQLLCLEGLSGVEQLPH